MKKNILKAVLLFSVVILLVSSCKKGDEQKYESFVSKSLKVSYNTTYINNMFDAVASTYSEAADLKQYVSGNVDVYKVVYKTTVNNTTINASGLVCVPSAAGEYPVMCFQNGTNTINSNAPSVNVINPYYQLIEMVASMDYIVVIPDYPGFGESSDVTHPYLITEPTVKSIVDMLYALKEMVPAELPDITIKDEYYLIGYSQGGWATLALDKAIEQNYSSDFNLKGSVCGAGPYDLNILLRHIAGLSSYSNPVFLGYIINAYSAYSQFTNPVSDIFKEPYASRLSSLYSGNMTSEQINEGLTTSIPDLLTSDFISGFESDSKFLSVRNALSANSITAWQTSVPLFLIHGGSDSTVNPVTTESLYDGMIQAGTSTQICKKEIVPDVDHAEGIVPCMIKGLLFLEDIKEGR